MKTRIILGAVMLVIAVAILWLDYQYHGPLPAGWPVAAFLIVTITLAFRELSSMAARKGYKILPISGLAGTLTLAMLPMWWPMLANSLSQGQGVLMVQGLILVAIFIEQMAHKRTENALHRVACTVLAVAYLGVGSAMILTIRIIWGLPMLLVFLAGVKFADMGAYFTGRMLGRHKLIPWLSPGKTWEGLAGGLIIGAAAAMTVHWSLGLVATGLLWAVMFGGAMALAGQVGDLCESLLKRSANVKDSGSVLPEFGGVLDVLDSPLLAASVGLLMLMTTTPA